MGKHKVTYQGIVSDKLSSMEIGDIFSKKEFILEHWEEYNYYVCRSFDVIFTNSKKNFPDKQFRAIKRFITRLS